MEQIRRPQPEHIRRWQPKRENAGQALASKVLEYDMHVVRGEPRFTEEQWAALVKLAMRASAR